MVKAKQKQKKQMKKKQQRRRHCDVSIHACVHSDHKKVKTLPKIQLRERERAGLAADSDSDGRMCTHSQVSQIFKYPIFAHHRVF